MCMITPLKGQDKRCTISYTPSSPSQTIQNTDIYVHADETLLDISLPCNIIR